jgi:hypothetical protein
MAETQNFHHVIATAFNCVRSRNPNDAAWAVRAKPGWMEERLELFERYCLPSVLAQTNQNFRWMVYFDHSTSEEHLERVRRGLAGRPNFFIKLCSIFGSETLQEDFAADLDPSVKWLVTTRLDNDDGLHRDFIRNLQAQVRVGVKEALDFPYGIVYANGVPYWSRQKSNAFISLSEPMENMRTVFATRHKEMSRRYKIRTVGTEPAWLQSVHGLNVSNGIRGWRIANAQIPAGFELGDAPTGESLSPSGILMENATLGVARYFRDRLADAVNAVRHPPWSKTP